MMLLGRPRGEVLLPVVTDLQPDVSYNEIRSRRLYGLGIRYFARSGLAILTPAFRLDC